MSKYKVRRTRNGTWAVDRITEYGTRKYTKDYTRYFGYDEEKAIAYKEQRENEKE